MADKKVYGMYENKCKEEVIPMQNICTFTGEINAEKDSVTILFPDAEASSMGLEPSKRNDEVRNEQHNSRSIKRIMCRNQK